MAEQGREGHRGASVSSLAEARSARRPTEPKPGAESEWPEADRRAGVDRRDEPTRGFAALFGGPRRRKGGRRAGEGRNTYVDIYSPRDVVLLLGVFVLNVFDAFFTLRWLQMGGGEANPIMLALLEQGDLLFLIQKCIVVGVWLVLLIVHKNFPIARAGLWMLMACYGAVMIYHFFLQASASA